MLSTKTTTNRNSITRFKFRLRDIYLPNPQLMVTGAKIYLGINLRPSQLIKQIINPRQRVSILDDNPIQLPIVYT